MVRHRSWFARRKASNRNPRTNPFRRRQLLSQHLEQRQMLAAEWGDSAAADRSALLPAELAFQRATDLNQFSRQDLESSNEWLVRLSEGLSTEQIAMASGAVDVRPIDLLPNTYLVSFDTDNLPANLPGRLSGLENVTGFYPLVAQQPQKLLIPNDPLFPQQWHLQNTGQGGGTPGADANVTSVWDSYTGEGVVIAVVDDGLEYTHPDLSARYISTASFDFNDDNDDPFPGSPSENHGTAVAGVAAATGNNGIGVSGAAPEASLSGIRLIAGPVTDLTVADALSFQNQTIDVYNHSWKFRGPVLGSIVTFPLPLTLASLADGAETGRDGLGSIHVWAGGNDGLERGNVNDNPLANSKHTIAVGAIDNRGIQSWYSEPGAPLIVSAYSNGGSLGITTTDLNGGYRDNFGGTSSAAPLVSGVIALMLEANPSLTARDVQHILVNSARLTDPTDSDWVANGAGRRVNHKYGFGAIDAAAAVSLAETWTNVGDEITYESGELAVNTPIPDFNPTGVVASTTVDEEIDVEYVEVVFSATHSYRGDLRLVLTSPSGTESVLAESRLTDFGNDYNRWVFTTARNWGENSRGTWSLRVADGLAGDVGTFESWELNIHGAQWTGGVDSGPTGPQLLAVRPDSSGLLQDGDVLNVAPREFNLYFGGGASIDPTTINSDSVRLIRSGGDGDFENGFIEVEVGYVGFVNPGSTDPSESQRIVVRPASSAAWNATDESFAFPDDFYQLQVIGTGDDPLQNQFGEAFGSGTDYVLNFRLDRGAQVVSVVPQPILRTPGPTPGRQELTQRNDQIVVYFDDQALNQDDAEDPRFFRLINTQGTADPSDDTIMLPESAVYDRQTNSITLTFADDIPMGTYRLDVGQSGGLNETTATAIRVGTLFDENRFDFNGYLDDINGQHDDDDDVDLYQVELEPGTLEIDITPQEPGLALTVALLDSAGDEIPGASVTTAPGVDDSIPSYEVLSAGTFFIRVTSAGGTGSYLLQASVTGNPIDASDDNNTFNTATDLGSLGAAGLSLIGEIEPQLIPLPPWAGGQDEPGHRQIQREVHIPLLAGTVLPNGTTPTVPAEIRQRFYHFPDTHTNFLGRSFPNEITEAEKQIVRTIFEIYASLSGYEFTESEIGEGFEIGKTDLRAFQPDMPPTSPVAGLGGLRGAIANAARFQDANRSYGDGFTRLMFHEIGHSLGLFHSYELPSVMGDPDNPPPGNILPGDHDIVHLQRLVPPNSTDIDMYRFDVSEAGTLQVETLAERLALSSRLDTVLTLYRENDNGERELIARNNRYFGRDSFLEFQVQPGTYFVGVSSAGNENYDPNVPDSGYGGTTDGVYSLKLHFQADRGGLLRDADGTAIDGNGDGSPGGKFSFWFQASDPANTIYVDRTNDPLLGGTGGTGTLADPFANLDTALEAARTRIVVPIDTSGIQAGDQLIVDDGVNRIIFTFGGESTGTTIDRLALDMPTEIADRINAQSSLTTTATVDGQVIRLSAVDDLDLSGTPTLLHAPNIVRIVGNGGLDGDDQTVADNIPYLVGVDTDDIVLRDGAEFVVPQGTTVVLDAGTLIKMRKANLDAGTSSLNVNRAAASIQVLGTPALPVWLRSFHDDSFGGDSDGIGDLEPGDFGGIVFRQDSDMATEQIYLNHVTHLDVSHGGGKVFVDSEETVFSPIHIINSRPTARFNTIRQSAAAAISANPDSFDDSDGRIGPDILGNYLLSNSIDGLFIRVQTPAGDTIEKVTLPIRFNDSDITHVLTENLIIEGNPGGPLNTAAGLVARAAGRIVVDPGIVLKMQGARIEAERGASSLIAEGTPNRPVIFTSLRDDRFGGSGSFDTTSNGFTTGSPGQWAGIYLGHLSSGSIDNALITFGGGDSPIEGATTTFNVLEVHQANLRITNSEIRDNANGNASGSRNGRGVNSPATLYVRGSQPVVVDNVFVNNAGPVASINANSLNHWILPDYGRSTGAIDRFTQFDDNHGPLIRRNRLDNNAINGVVIRGEELTTESVWDDTDIVHVLQNTITVDNFHTYGGLRLQSSNSESLVIKLAGAEAGFTATGTPLDIVDRVGGTIHVLGRPGFPVLMTHLDDDSVGAGFAPNGSVVTNTNNSASPTTGAVGGWRGLLFDQWSNDRNVAIVRENETPLTSGRDVNRTIATAQQLGQLAPNQKSGDETRRLGFEVHGFISPDDPGDVDIYSFRGTAGTPVWIDIDRTDPTLDVIVEILASNGTVLARSVRSGDVAFPGTVIPSTSNPGAFSLTQNPLLGGDYWSQNFRDAGMHYVLHGTPGSVGTYYVRVRSAPGEGTPVATLDGQSTGKYQLQIRLQQRDEFPGSTVRFADIRYAATAIDVRGLPRRSPFLGEAAEIEGNNTFASAQQLVNLLETDMAAINLAGSLSGPTDVDWYQFDVQHQGIQVISGRNDDPGMVSVVFDLNYADGATRGDTTVAVYDSAGRLIWVGRESNIEDDQREGAGIGTTDLSRGSFGTRDAYIGPINVRPTGTYYVAVMSNQTLPSAMVGVFQEEPALPANRLTRLEPVNTVRRVVEDHIGFVGHTSLQLSPFEPPVRVTPETGPIIDLNNLDDHIVPFRMEDVVLYVATDQVEFATQTNNNDHLYTVNPFTGQRYLTRVSGSSGFVSGVNDFQDIVIRSDGAMYGYRRLNGVTNSVGSVARINPEDGSIVSEQNDNIPGRGPTPNVNDGSIFPGNYFPATNQDNRLRRAEEFTTSDEVDALTFWRRATTGPASAPVPVYDTYLVVRETDNPLSDNSNSKLYRGRADGNAEPGALGGNNTHYGLRGNIQPADVQFASSTFSVFDNADTPNRTDIRIQSKLPGSAGNDIDIVLSRPNNNNATVNVEGTTIFLNIGGTGGTPLTGAPNAATIVNAINNNQDARRLVTAVIVGGNNNGNGNNGTVALNVLGANGNLSGGSDGAVGPLLGRVTGISFDTINPGGNPGNRLFGVTTAGEFIRINPNNGNVLERQVIFDPSGNPFVFEGLALGPQNVNEGQHQNTLFAVTRDDRLVALDASGSFVNAFQSGNTTQVVTVAEGVADTFSMQVSGMAGNAIGLAFSPLDFNLWHPTMRRGNDAGHGINNAPDSSRFPGQINQSIPNSNRVHNEAAGGVSMHFGFEQWSQSQTSSQQVYLPLGSGNSQYGIRNPLIHQDLSSNSDIVGTYNFPGGALGTLVTNPFSLEGSTYLDRPTLYFNYFLETEKHPGSSRDSDVNDPFRDSARVFASRDGGETWELVATNSARLSGADPTIGGQRAELPGFLSHLSEASQNSLIARPESHQIVQQLFDSTGVWRQARIDLSTFADEADVRLRFDFSTAGSMNDDSLIGIDGEFDPNNVTDAAPYGEYASRGNDPRSIRSLNNRFEGFYIDDIIVGYAERGEMVTGAPVDSTTTNLAAARTQDRDPRRLPNLLAGRYQLEIRRVDDVGTWVEGQGIAVTSTFDTNDRHINDLTVSASTGFEASDPAHNLSLPTDLVLPGVNDGNPIPTSAMHPWELTTTDPIFGNHSLVSAANYATLPPLPELPDLPSRRPLSVYQTTPQDLGSTSTGGGLVTFTYNVSSREETHGLLFLIDGVPQLIIPPTPATEGDPGFPGAVLASGETGNRSVQFSFPSPTSTLTWIYLFFDEQDNPAGANQARIDNLQILQGGTGREADRNRDRQQGMFIIEANTITDSSVRGINVQPGVQEAPGVPLPGSTINFALFDSDRLVPGVVIKNNIVAGSSGIRFAGDTSGVAQRAVPFGRIVNNTLVGNNAGVGVQIDGIASPTVMNNIITQFTTGIGGATDDIEIEYNYFQGNTANGPLGADAIVRDAATPLFVDAANRNFYLVAGSDAVDSSLDLLQDRADFFASFKNQLGIPPSPIFAPDRDVYGQLRVVSGTSAGGGGTDPFKDRGAADRSDLDAPFAVLLDPIDNDNAGLDLDPNVTVVALADPIKESFSILLTDGPGPNAAFQGTGIDPATVSPAQVTVRRNNVTLVEGVDYSMGYNTITGELRLTPLSTLWQPASVYEITLDNKVIADRSGRKLRSNQRSNQTDDSTRFWIILPDVGLDYGDAPNSFQTRLDSNGARHALINDAFPRLGWYVDAESDAEIALGSADDVPRNMTAVVEQGIGRLVVNGNGTGTPQLEIIVAEMPQARDAIRIDSGREEVVFELVPVYLAPGLGNTAVRFDTTTDTVATIATKLAGAIKTRFHAPGDAFAVSVDSSISLQNQATSPHAVTIMLPEETDGGEFVLAFADDTDTGIEAGTVVIASDATREEIEAALQDITGLAGNVTVIGGPLPDAPVTILFGGDLTGQVIQSPTVDSSGLIALPASITVTDDFDDGRAFEVEFSGNTTGGTFTLTVEDPDGEGVLGTTDPIAHDADALTILAALETIDGLAGRVAVTRTPADASQVRVELLLNLADSSLELNADAGDLQVDPIEAVLDAKEYQPQHVTITIPATVMGGSFVLGLVDPENGIDGQSDSIAFNADPTVVQDALEAILGDDGSSFPLAGNIEVAAGAESGQYIVTFVNALAGMTVAPFTVVSDLATTIRLENFDDEDGVGVSTLSAGGQDYIVFSRPSDSVYPTYADTISDPDAVLGFLNPQDPAGTQVAITVQGTGYLDAWIDLNGNGVFETTFGEKVLDSVPVVDGLNILTIHTPPGTTDGERWMRVRLSPEGGLEPTGLAVGGEVEDYLVQVINVAPVVAADDLYEMLEDGTGLDEGRLDTARDSMPSLIDNDDFDTDFDPLIDPDTFVPYRVVVVDEPEFAEAFELDPETGHFTYTPLRDFAGIDTFTYYVALQQSGIDADLDLTLPSIATVTIDVRPVNDPPLAQNQRFTTLESQPTPAAGDPLMIELDNLPVGAEVDDVAVLSSLNDGLVPLVDVTVGTPFAFTVTLPGGTDSGSYIIQLLDDNGDLIGQTESIAWDADADSVRAALEAIDTLESANVTVTGGTFLPEPPQVGRGQHPLTITASDLLADAVAHSNPQYPVDAPEDPWDETDQQLRVVEVIITDDPTDLDGTGYTSDDADPSTGLLDVPTLHGTATLRFAVVDGPIGFIDSVGSLIDIVYVSNDYLNRDNVDLVSVDRGDGTAVSVFDFFRFTMEDDGLLIDPQQVNASGDIETDVEETAPRLTHTAFAAIDVAPQNDYPIPSATEENLVSVGPIGSGILLADGTFGSMVDTPWVLFHRPVVATLTTLIDETASVLTVADTDSLPEVPFSIRINDEVMTVTEVDEETGEWTVARGDNTAVHAAGVDVRLDLEVPVPTEDTALFIPAQFLLQSDLVGQVISTDESGGLNDGDLRIIQVDMVTIPASGGGSVMLGQENDSDGVWFVAPTDWYGEVVFTYIVQDTGIDEDAEGNRVENRLTATGTVTVMVQPVNDAPVAYPRALEFVESGNPVRDVFEISPADFLMGTEPEIPAIPGPDTADLDERFDEREQRDALRVVAFQTSHGTVDVADLGNYDGPGTGSGMLELESDAGGHFEFDIVDGALESARFVTAVDYNRRFEANPVEWLTFWIEDDGKTTDPQDTTNVIELPAERSAPQTLTITVQPTNDAPEFPDFAMVVFPEDINGLGATVYYDIYNEDGNVAALLESNDPDQHELPQRIFPSRDTALDERELETLTFTITTLHEPEGMFAADPVIDVYGVLTLQPNPNVFGYSVFELTATDNGQSYDADPDSETFGQLIADPRSTSRTVTIFITPVNDPPVTVDREVEVVEAEEFADVTNAPTDDVAHYEFFPADFLGGTDANPELARPSSFSDGNLADWDVGEVEYDEDEQELRVVVFTVTDVEGNEVVIDAENFNGVEITLATGRITFHFDDIADGGAFTHGVYFPNVDYNERDPFVDSEQFTYVIEDFGETRIPGSNYLDNPADPLLGEFERIDYTADADPNNDGAVYNRSEPRTMTIRVRPTNDAPLFDSFASVDILERDDSQPTVIENFVFNLLPGAMTALDELARQAITFQIVSQSPESSGLMLQSPTIELTSGGPDNWLDDTDNPIGTARLILYPAPDAVGTVVYVFEAIDDEPGSDDFSERRTQATVAVNIRPVNDAPRLNLDVLGQSEENNPDDAYSVDQQGRITYVLREDNTPPVGQDPAPYVLNARDLSAADQYGPIGLLDVFTVGPENEADDTLGGNQSLFIIGFDEQTTLGGTIAAETDSEGVIVRLLYTPPRDVNSNFAPQDSFTYTVTDDGQTWVPTSLTTGQLVDDPLTITNTVYFTLNPVNDPPIFTATRDTVAALEDALEVSVPGYAVNIFSSDHPAALDERDLVLGQSVVFDVTPIDPANQTIADTLFGDNQPRVTPNGTLIFRPAPDQFGTAVFEVVLEDSGDSNPDRGDVNRSTVETLTITIQPQNDAPRFANDQPVAFSVQENQELLIPLRAAPGEPQGLLDKFVVGPANEAADITPGGNQTLSLGAPIPTTTVQSGSLALVTVDDQPFLRYRPRPNFNGVDSFQYVVTDDGVSVDLDGTVRPDPRSAFFTVDLFVGSVNNPPQFSGAGNVSALEDAGEDDPGIAPEDVGLTVIENWITNILPGPPTAIDELETQEVSFVIAPVDDAVARSIFAVDEDGNLRISATGTTDPLPGSLRFRTLPDANGTAVFTVIAIDDGPSDPPNVNTSAPRTFTITIVPVNDPPTFEPGPGMIEVDEDSGTYSQPWATNVLPGPPDEVAEGQTVRFEVVTLPEDQALFSQLPGMTPGGTLFFTPAPDAFGTATVTITPIDSLDLAGESVELTIVIDQVPDAPIAVDDAFQTAGDTVLVMLAEEVLANDIDVDLPDDQLTISLTAAFSLNGATISLDADNNVIYDPRDAIQLQSLAPGESLVDTFTYFLTDSFGLISNQATISVTVDGVNNPPLAFNDNFDVPPTGSTVLRPLDNDIDVDGQIDPASIMLTLQPAFGSVEVRNDGTLLYTPFVNFRGNDLMRYTVADNLGARSNVATITIASNQAPVAVNDRAGTFRDEAVEIDVLANDFDPDGEVDPATVVIVTPPGQGAATVLADGRIRYVPATGFVGMDSFTYRVSDNLGRASEPATVTVQTVASRLQNPIENADVNADGVVSPFDALLIINYLNRGRPTNLTTMGAWEPSLNYQRGDVVLFGGQTFIAGQDIAAGQQPEPGVVWIQAAAPFFDVDGNNRIEPFDALRVINVLNRRGREAFRGGAQGEAADDAVSYMIAPQPLVSALQTESQVVMLDPESTVPVPMPKKLAKVVEAVDDVTAFSATTRLEEDDVLDMLAQDQASDEDEEALSAVDRFWSAF